MPARAEIAPAANLSDPELRQRWVAGGEWSKRQSCESAGMTHYDLGLLHLQVGQSVIGGMDWGNGSLMPL